MKEMRITAVCLVSLLLCLVLLAPSWAEKSPGQDKTEAPKKAQPRQAAKQDAKKELKKGSEETANKAAIIARVGSETLTGEILERKIEALPAQYQKMIQQNPQLRQNFIDR